MLMAGQDFAPVSAIIFLPYDVFCRLGQE
jgi:hypothetical protein